MLRLFDRFVDRSDLMANRETVRAFYVRFYAELGLAPGFIELPETNSTRLRQRFEKDYVAFYLPRSITSLQPERLVKGLRVRGRPVQLIGDISQSISQDDNEVALVSGWFWLYIGPKPETGWQQVRLSGPTLPRYSEPMSLRTYLVYCHLQARLKSMPIEPISFQLTGTTSPVTVTWKKNQLLVNPADIASPLPTRVLELLV